MSRWLRITLSLGVVLALAVTAGFCLRRWGFGLVRVTGTSMMDTLQTGDVALVTRWAAARGELPRRGEVVQCRFPNRPDSYIKRVIGLPGERVAFSDGALSVDGLALSEPYVSSATGDFAVTLGEDEYLLLGDNRAESYDGRMPDMGTPGEGDILGRVRWVLWPLNRFGPVE